MANDSLGDARRAKNDEFYTQYVDIEKEMNAYLEFNPEVFKGKTILLPCDDPEWSNFTRYFAQNFQTFGLKKLISTSYAPNSKPKEIPYQPTLFDSPDFDEEMDESRGKIFSLEHDKTGNGVVNFEDLEWSYLEGDGDFLSDEVKTLRDEADIIITNPPFSKFRIFWDWLIESEKDFVIIGNMNAITYKEVFPLIRDNKMWLGNGFSNGNAYFASPVSRDYAAGVVDKDTGLIKFRNVVWFSTLDHGRRHEPMQLMTMAENMKFSKHDGVKGGYRRYDNYDAIEVPRVEAIPSDYDGVMGVPISFLSKYNPEQFEIVGTMAQSEPNYPYRTKFYSNQEQRDAYFRRFGKEGMIPLNMSGVIDDVKVYQRIMIRHRKADK